MMDKLKIKPEIVTFIAIWVIGGIILFLRPIIGIADNGQYYKIMNKNDLYYLLPEEEKVGFFNKEYGVYKYAREDKESYFSTENLVIKVAMNIKKIFSNDNRFDIRYLAFILLGGYSLAGYLLVKYFTSYINKYKYKLLIAMLYIFIFCDIGYIAYFNSFYEEGLIISAFLLSIGILLNISSFNKISFLNILAFALASLMFIGAKEEVYIVGLIIAMIFIKLFIMERKKSLKITSIIFSLLFIAITAGLYIAIPKNVKYINKFHAMNRGILLYGENKEEILREFNIESNYALLEGETFFEEIASIDPKDERLLEDFYSKYSYLSIGKYYLKNPTAFIKAIKMAVNNAYSIRPSNLGNFEKLEGYNFGKRANFLNGWSYIKEKFLPKNILFFIIFIGIYFTFLLKEYIKGYKEKDKDKIFRGDIYIYIFLAGFSQILMSTIMAGDADLGRQGFLYNISFDLMLIYIITKLIETKGRKEYAKQKN